MMRIEQIAETNSTNAYLQGLLLSKRVEEGTVIVAKKQLHGRGQRGNTWEAEEGKNLTFSLLLRPQKLPTSNLFLLSEAVSVGIVEALSRYVADLSIKWPNDIYWKNRKLGGILIENSLIGTHWEWSIVGIGLNILQERFSKELPNPVSLVQIKPQNYSLEAILNAVLKGIEQRYSQLLAGKWDEIQKVYHSHLYLKDTKAEYIDQEGRFQGILREVAPSGKVSMEKEDGKIHSYWFKEIEFVIKKEE